MKKLYGIISFILLVLIDQVTKYIVIKDFALGEERELIPNVFSLEYIRNTGAAWGIMQDKTYLFAVFSAVVCLLLFVFYFKIPTEKKYNILSIIIIFLISGAVGNLIDRCMRKYVIDFFYFKLIDFPVFNMADIYVTLAAIALIIVIMFFYKDEDFEFISLNKKKVKENLKANKEESVKNNEDK